MQDNSWVSLFPEEASGNAWQVDYAYFYVTAVTLFFTVLIVGLIAYFTVRYREREKYATGAAIHGSLPMETFWAVSLFVIAVSLFLVGAIVYYNQYRQPEDTMEIFVVGKQWMWKAQHGTGQREINELHVPVGRRIKLTMTTEDVIHSFYIPAFRIKSDVVPGRYTSLWFEATKPGKYHLLCTEYCGMNHSGMGGYIYVMEQRDFDDWLAGNVSGQTPIEAGRELFENKLGCASCHQLGVQTQTRCPNLTGIHGSERKLTSGQTVTADDEYIRNSILNPSAQIVEGYQPIMPTFKGQVTEEQLIQLVAYIKSLSGNSGGAGTNGAGTGSGNSNVNESKNFNSNNYPNNSGGGSSQGSGTGSAANNLVPRRANRGAANNQGSNPNAPGDEPENPRR